MERVAVYTAIFGGYDYLKEQPLIPGVDYVCFTDDPGLTAPGWRVIVGKARHLHPRLSAKWYRTHPHRVLSAYRRSIYIDGSVQILTPDFVPAMLAALGNRDMALFQHPARHNVRDEAEFCVPIEKYRGQPMVAQVDHYAALGFPDQSGLYATGLIARRHRTRTMRRFGRAWMQENVRWTYQDQLSAPYLFWKFGITPGVVPNNLWDNPLFTLIAHTSEL